MRHDLHNLDLVAFTRLIWTGVCKAACEAEVTYMQPYFLFGWACEAG